MVNKLDKIVCSYDLSYFIDKPNFKQELINILNQQIDECEIGIYGDVSFEFKDKNIEITIANIAMEDVEEAVTEFDDFIDNFKIEFSFDDYKKQLLNNF